MNGKDFINQSTLRLISISISKKNNDDKIE